MRLPAIANGDDIVYPSAIPFILVHVACIGAIWSGITWEALTICVALYWLRIFAIGAGYHRYFSHRSYSTSRLFQFLLAVAAQTTAQKSVLWWAAMHRHHHSHSDTEEDVHSPRHRGFLYSHIGWIFARRNDSADLGKVADLSRFPELRFLHKFEVFPALALAALCFLVAGWSGLVVGFLWSTVLVYHATFCINSLAHVRGSARYVTGDNSRNNWLLALFTMGEGWHNNHHAFQSSVRQGFRWWEIDPTYYLLRALSWVGVVWDLKTPPSGSCVTNSDLARELLTAPPSSSQPILIQSGWHSPSPPPCTALNCLPCRICSAERRPALLMCLWQCTYRICQAERKS